MGRANSSSFINVTSGGFGSEITATTPVEMKKALGGGAYTIMGMIKAFKLKPYEGRLLVPGEKPIAGNMLMMAVGNNRLAGGGFEVAPKARLDDGLLDLAIVSKGEGSLKRLKSELEHLTILTISSCTIGNYASSRSRPIRTCTSISTASPRSKIS